MHPIKLVAADLDGTLLTRKKEMTPRLSCALEGLRQRGIFFVPATGRPLGSLPACVREIPALRYAITSNGAVVYDLETEQPLVTHFLSPAAVECALALAAHPAVLPEFFCEGKAYLSRAVLGELERYGLTESHMQYIRATRIPLEDVPAALASMRDRLENINLIFGDAALRRQAWDALRAGTDAAVTSSSPKNIEITAPQATKAHALATLCTRLGIAPAEVLAMGDSDNDLPMLQFAGVGVAMANGEAHIKAAADVIADDCDDFGAAKIMEALLEKGVWE